MLLFLLAIFLSACKSVENTDIEVIDLKELTPVNLNISQFTTDMHVIPLETSPDCLLSNINNIKFDDKFIYIKDVLFNGIYVFDRAGKFVDKLYKEGQGAGEYLSIYDFTVDKEKNTIEIFDGRSNKLLIYELTSFNYIGEFSVPLSVAFRFEKKDGIYYFYTSGLRNTVNEKKTNSDIIAFDPTTKKLLPLFDKILPDNVNRSFNINGFSVNKKGHLFFSKVWHDQFYIIDKMSATPILTIDAGTHSIPARIKNGTYEQQEQFINAGISKGQYLFFRLALYDDDKVIVLFTNGTNPYDLHYYMRFGGEEYLTNTISIDFIKDKPNLVLDNTFIIENTLISVTMPGEEQSPEMKNYMANLGIQDEDNPILTLFNIK